MCKCVLKKLIQNRVHVPWNTFMIWTTSLWPASRITRTTVPASISIIISTAAATSTPHEMFEQSRDLWWDIHRFCVSALVFSHTFAVIVISQKALCTETPPNAIDVSRELDNFIATQSIVTSYRRCWSAHLYQHENKFNRYSNDKGILFFRSHKLRNDDYICELDTLRPKCI